MHRCYLAAPIFNENQLRVVGSITQLVKMVGFDYFSPYEASQGIWKGRAPKDCSAEERGQVLKGNIDNLHWADTLIAWVGGTNGSTDTGVTWEMGYFNAVTDWRRVLRERGMLPENDDDPEVGFTLGYIHPQDHRQNMNLMLAGTVDAVAYGNAQLHQALELLRSEKLDKAREDFHPDLVIKHEREPIV